MESLVKTRKTTKPAQLAMVKQFLLNEKYGVYKGFYMAHKVLLESLANDDRDALFDICEGTLYRKLSDALDLVKERNLKLELINA